MATKEWFEYVDPETGKTAFECPALQGQYILAKQITNAMAFEDHDTEGTVMSTLWSALSADAKGHKVLPRGVKRGTDINAFVGAMADAIRGGYIISFADKYTVLFHSEQVENNDGEEIEKNPTDTNPVLS